MEATETSEGLEDTPPPKRWRRLRWVFWPVVFLFLLVTVPLVFLSVAGATVKAPDWLVERVERMVNDRVDGARFRVPNMQLVVDTRLRPQVQMRNVGVYDKNDTEIAVLDQISAKLAPRNLFQGAASMRALNISGALITVRRGPNGKFDLSFGTGAEASGDLAKVLDSLDQAFTVEPLASMGEITADHVTISLEDARSGGLWQVTDGRISLTHSEDSLDLSAAADVFNGTEDLASTVIGFRTEKGSARATLTATFENARASDIAAQSPVLGFLSVLEAPISGALRTTLDEEGLIEDLSGTLTLGEGALQPTPGTPPIAFEYAQAYLDYDPDTQTIAFSQLAFESETAALSGIGTTSFQEFRGRWPSSFVGQFQVSDLRFQPKGVFAEPMTFDRGALEFRVRLDPFMVDIGQVSLGPKEQRLLAKGRVRATDQGWAVALDLTLNKIARDRILALWPVAVAKGARDWVGRNVLAGNMSDLSAALRLAPDARPKVSIIFQYSDATVQVLKFLPAVKGVSGYASLDGKSFTTVVESGHVTAPEGGDVDVAGSYFKVLDITAETDRAKVQLNTDSTITAALSLLNQEPLTLMDNAGVAVDVAGGRAIGRATLNFDLIDKLLIKDVAFEAEGDLIGVKTTSLIKNRTLLGDRLTFRADPGEIEIQGQASIDGLPVNGSWSQPIGPDAPKRSQVVGTLELSQKFLDAFNIALPPGSLTGAGVGQMSIDLIKGEAPRFELRSDLNRLGLTLKALGWSKPRNRTGTFEIIGRLGDVPSIDQLRLNASGLSVSGVIDLTPSGGLRTAQFDRVRLGGWLDGPVTLTGQGGNRPPAVAITGGVVDLRKAELGSSSSGEPGGPMRLRLDRLVITEGIVLRSFRGDFKAGRGMDGTFTATVNGGPSINGTVIPTPAGSAIQIRSGTAGEVLAAAGVISNARRGSLDLTLNPSGRTRVYNGRLKIRNTRIYRAPALTELISAISIIGLIDQLNTGGISLSDVEAEFQVAPDRLILLGSSAIGPSIGVSLDGLYNLKTNRLDMQGVMSPVYFLNGIGQIFSRGRDGLFGFNFRLTGTADSPKVRVNPLSILTPGAFREIFRRPPPSPSQ